MPNDQSNWVAPAAFFFRVDIAGGGQDTSFQEVDGIETKLEVETVTEGGENRFQHRLPKAMTHPNLVLKRGVAAKSSKLVTWCIEVLEGTLAKPIQTKALDVHLLDSKAEPMMSWSVVNAFPVGWTIEGFNSTKNDVAIERIELAYNYVSRIK